MECGSLKPQGGRNRVELLEVWWHCIVSSVAGSTGVSFAILSFGVLGFELRVALWSQRLLRKLAEFGIGSVCRWVDRTSKEPRVDGRSQSCYIFSVESGCG